MKQLCFYLLLFVLFILQSCSFEPKGEHFVEINQTGTPPNIQINLNLATDTLFIPQNEKVTFAYGLDASKVNWAQFIVNGQPGNRIDTPSSSFELTKTFNDTPGTTLSLELTIFTKSQTGSMGDIYGAEGFMLSKKWTVVIKNTVQMASQILKVEFVNGAVRIEWEKYKGVDFNNYKLYKVMPWTQHDKFLLATRTILDQTSFVDTTYHGEESQYYIVNNDRFQGTSRTITGPIPVLTAENNMNGDILLKWTKPPYYKNLSGYRISYRDRLLNILPLAEVANRTSESFIIPNPIFAHTYELYLTPVGLSDNYYNEWNSIHYLSTQAQITYGIPIPKYTAAHSGPDPVTWLINDTDGILRFDHRTMTTTRKIKYKDFVHRFNLSSNGKYMVSCAYAPLKIYFEDLIDSTKSKSIDISASFPQMQYVTSVSNAGTGIMINNKTAVMYDYINERKLAETLLTNTDYWNSISASGNFFYLASHTSSEYYQYKDNRIVLLQTGTNQGVDQVLNAEYLPGNNEKLVRVFHDRVEVVDCNTWTIEKKWLFPIQISTAYNLDSKTGKMLLCQDPKLILLDVLNGTKEEVATLDEMGHYDLSFFYNYGQILWGQGKASK